MRWKLRDGIILTTVCGQSFLVRNDSAGHKRVSAVNINDSAAFICQKLRDGYSMEEIKRELPNEFEIPDNADLDNMIYEFINSLEEQGYIVSAD